MTVPANDTLPSRPRSARLVYLGLAVTLTAGAVCTPDSLLSTVAAPDATSQSAQSTESDSPHMLSTAELDVLLRNAEDGRVTVVFVSPHSGEPNDPAYVGGIPGPQGPPGPAGPVGPIGPAGAGAFIGEIRMFAGDPANPPPGWLTCDGRAIDRVLFPKLFATVGTRFGPGNGLSTFNLPDYRNRTPMGANVAGPLGRPMTTVEGVPRFEGGDATRTISIAQMPAHHHSLVHTHNLTGTDSGTVGNSMVQLVDAISTTTTVSTASASVDLTTSEGGSAPLPVVDPYFAVTFVIFTGE